MSVDYANKARVLSTGLPDVVRLVERTLAFHGVWSIDRERRTFKCPYKLIGQDYTPSGCSLSINQAIATFNYWYPSNPSDWWEAVKINQAYWNRRGTLRRRLWSILSSPSVFVTLTFTDDVLRSTSEDTRRTYVRKFLSSISENYVANIDYGSEKGREHYHAVVGVPRLDPKAWTYGALNVRRITYSGQNNDKKATERRLEKYMTKLTAHALKTSTKGNKVIYSRK